MNEELNKTQKFFDELAKEWDKRIELQPKKIELIIQLADIKEGSRVLDVATGTGVLIPEISNMKPKEIIALDLSPKMIEIALSKKENKSAQFLAADFYSFKSDKFDRIICYQCYPHFKDKERFIQQIFDLLNPDGRFIIAHPDSRNKINNRHQGKKTTEVSHGLKEAWLESKRFDQMFKIDTLIDTDELYIISGVKRDSM